MLGVGSTGCPASPRSSTRPGSEEVEEHGAAAKIPFSSSNVETILNKIREFSNKNLSEDGLKNLIDDIDWVKRALISGSSTDGVIFSGDYKGIKSVDRSHKFMFHDSTHRQDISKNIASVLEVFNAVLKTSVDEQIKEAINNKKKEIADEIVGGNGTDLLLKKLKNVFGPNNYEFKATPNPLSITDYKYNNADDFVTGHIVKGVAKVKDPTEEIQYWENFCLALKNEAKSKKGSSGLKVDKVKFETNVADLKNIKFNEEIAGGLEKFIKFHNETLVALELFSDVNTTPSPSISMPSPHISPSPALATAEAARLLKESGLEREVSRGGRSNTLKPTDVTLRTLSKEVITSIKTGIRTQINALGLNVEEKKSVIAFSLGLAGNYNTFQNYTTLLTTQDLIDLYQQAGSLTGANQYDYKGNKIDAIKKVEITPDATSDILTFSLKRFNRTQNNSVKNNEPIDINEHITVKGETYRVKSIGIHSGSYTGGHYYAYNRDGEDWFRMDDSRVSTVSQEEVLKMASGQIDPNSQAYFLTYEKVKIGEHLCYQINGEITVSSIEGGQRVTTHYFKNGEHIIKKSAISNFIENKTYINQAIQPFSGFVDNGSGEVSLQETFLEEQVAGLLSLIGQDADKPFKSLSDLCTALDNYLDPFYLFDDVKSQLETLKDLESSLKIESQGRVKKIHDTIRSVDISIDNLCLALSSFQKQQQGFGELTISVFKDIKELSDQLKGNQNGRVKIIQDFAKDKGWSLENLCYNLQFIQHHSNQKRGFDNTVHTFLEMLAYSKNSVVAADLGWSSNHEHENNVFLGTLSSSVQAKNSEAEVPNFKVANLLPLKKSDEIGNVNDLTDSTQVREMVYDLYCTNMDSSWQYRDYITANLNLGNAQFNHSGGQCDAEKVIQKNPSVLFEKLKGQDSRFDGVLKQHFRKIQGYNPYFRGGRGDGNRIGGRRGHGPDHARGVMELTPYIVAAYGKSKTSACNKALQDLDFGVVMGNKDTMSKIEIAVGLHDIARTTHGYDTDEYINSPMTYFILRKNGCSHAEASLYSFAAANKDPMSCQNYTNNFDKVYSVLDQSELTKLARDLGCTHDSKAQAYLKAYFYLVCRTAGDADCLEIMRCRGQFDTNHYAFFKENINQAKKLLKLAHHNLVYGWNNYEHPVNKGQPRNALTITHIDKEPVGRFLNDVNYPQF